LLILLRLIDNKQINHKTLYGSWAGAFGFFQFMPSTMKNYAIDYDKNNYINLKNNKDAYASAANYLKKIGWQQDQPCFYKVNLSKKIPKNYLNVSAKNLHDKNKLKYFRKYIKNESIINDSYDNETVAIITPDKDIIPNAENLNPAYIVFNNYEVILKWNRSLRFSLAICTLKDKFKNEL
jgi:membrane-bound lytic murein transglycosylase B